MWTVCIIVKDSQVTKLEVKIKVLSENITNIIYEYNITEIIYKIKYIRRYSLIIEISLEMRLKPSFNQLYRLKLKLTSILIYWQHSALTWMKYRVTTNFDKIKKERTQLIINKAKYSCERMVFLGLNDILDHLGFISK